MDLLTLLTTAARTSYPWPLCWGNALWAVIAYKAANNKKDKPGRIFACLATFIMFTMPANIFTNLLLFGRTPTILMNAVAIPSHLACFAVLELGGGSLMPILSGAYVLTFIDSFGVLDNVTTAFNYMEEGFETTGAPIYCVLIGMMVNLAGGLVRHFAANGFAGGSKTFDAKLGGALLYSLAACSTYYWFAIKRCDDLAAARAGEKKFDAAAFVGTCRDDTHLYEALPLLAVARNAVLSLDLLPKGKAKKA